MSRITAFFHFCSGADRELLKQCEIEKEKYVGIGATVFFTGLFAAISCGFALFTVFDSYWIASITGILWGLMIFNLDRYIVSSMRKEGRASREFLLAFPRLILAILISIVIATPLELRIFAKEISPELELMTAEKIGEQEALIRARYARVQDSLRGEINNLDVALAGKTSVRDDLARAAREEADGTGGTRIRNAGPIYKLKKADADKADQELHDFQAQHSSRTNELLKMINSNDAKRNAEIQDIDRSLVDGPAARIEALDRLTSNSSAINLAHWFIILLFIAIETAPVFVKLISPRGPYDNVLRINENKYFVQEIEAVAQNHARAKTETASLPDREKTFVSDTLDAALDKS